MPAKKLYFEGKLAKKYWQPLLIFLSLVKDHGISRIIHSEVIIKRFNTLCRGNHPTWTRPPHCAFKPFNVVDYSFRIVYTLSFSAQRTGLGQGTEMAMAEAWLCVQLAIFGLILDVCFGSFSCWKIQQWPTFSFLAGPDWDLKCPGISWRSWCHVS